MQYDHWPSCGLGLSKTASSDDVIDWVAETQLKRNEGIC